MAPPYGHPLRPFMTHLDCKGGLVKRLSETPQHTLETPV